MKRFLTKILSITLAFAVLFATSSFTVDMHFCGNKLVNVAVLGKAKPCKDKEMDKESSSQKCMLGQKDCCSNKSIVKKAEDNLKIDKFKFSSDNFVFIRTFFYAYINLFEVLEQTVVPFVDYHPPFIEKDILVLHETFLL